MMSVTAAARAISHEDIFLARYERLLKWALHITGSDHGLAEDLVHESFVQFTLARPSLESINDPNNYLYSVLRNLHISHLRHTGRQRLEQISTFEDELIERGQLAVDPRRRLQVLDELHAVCRYACLRKESSISGSVLILRFFHGYFPSEVAKLLHTTVNAVNVRLKTARSEARSYLAKPESSQTNDRTLTDPQAVGHEQRFETDIFKGLRREIFAARRSKCFAREHLMRMYQTGEAAITRATLSHLVSCAKCLDEANRLLGLGLLHERNPMDALGMERETEDGLSESTARVCRDRDDSDLCKLRAVNF